jgi:hypothetical protein
MCSTRNCFTLTEKRNLFYYVLSYGTNMSYQQRHVQRHPADVLGGESGQMSWSEIVGFSSHLLPMLSFGTGCRYWGRSVAVCMPSGTVEPGNVNSTLMLVRLRFRGWGRLWMNLDSWIGISDDWLIGLSGLQSPDIVPSETCNKCVTRVPVCNKLLHNIQFRPVRKRLFNSVYLGQ